MTRARVLFVLFAANATSCTAAYDSGDFEVCDEPACADTLVPYAGSPVCEAETVDCAIACGTDDDCINTCVLGDANAIVCGLCGLNQLAVCGRDRGCRCAYDALNCCRVDNGCAGLGECAACRTQNEIWTACLRTVVDECEDEYRACAP